MIAWRGCDKMVISDEVTLAQEAYIEDIAQYEGQEVALKGWLYHKTDKGRLQFLLVRDGTGVIQCVVLEKDVPGPVFEAANAKEALDIFEREEGRFHLVFTDVVLPDLDGLELVDQLLSRKPQLRVLLSSGYTDDKSQSPVIRERGFPFLQKPYSLLDLLRAVGKAMAPS